ncbi:MAG: hypothetical protein ACO1SV_10700 [Fimbriimonas sp.]
MPDEPRERFPEGPNDEEIGARLRRVRDELSKMEGLPELPEDQIPQLGAAPTLPAAPDFDERLRDLEARAEAAKQRRQGKASAEQRKIEREADSNRGLGVGLTVAYAIIGVPLFGILVGWLVDRSMGTDLFKGLGALLGSIVGVAGAVFILNRYQNRIS